MRMLVDLDFPQDPSSLRVHRVDVGGLVAEVGDEFAVAALVERDRAADAGFDLQRPVDAAGLRVQHVDVALGGGDVHAAAGHDGLRAGRASHQEIRTPISA